MKNLYLVILVALGAVAIAGQNNAVTGRNYPMGGTRIASYMYANGASSPTAEVIGPGHSVGSVSINASGLNVAPTATEGFLLSLDTSTALNNVNGIIDNTNAATYRVGKNLYMEYYGNVRSAAATDEVFFFGFTDKTAATMVGSNAATAGFMPQGNFVGIIGCTSSGTQCNGGVGDTHFQCTSNNNSATANSVASTVSLDAAIHTFTMVMDDTNSRTTFAIDGVSVCSSPISTKYPTSGTNVNVVVAIKNTNNVAAKKVAFNYITMVTDR